MGISQGDTLQGGKYTIEDGRPLREGPTTVSYLARRDDGSRWVIKVLDPQILVGLSDGAERDRVKTLFSRGRKAGAVQWNAAHREGGDAVYGRGTGLLASGVYQ